MAPTIRVDDEIYQWLQSQARPFEDTPNSVLRRIAGLDAATRSSSMEESKLSPLQLSRRQVKHATKTGRRSPAARGENLIKQWDIPVRQARFSYDGTWYQHLEHFPAALCDADGYVIFNNEQEYLHCNYLRLGKELNVPGGISKIPNYRTVSGGLSFDARKR